MIPFNKPYLTGKEMHYMYQAVYSGKISGNGLYTSKCQHFFEEHYGFKKALLTSSCTDALEMSAILADIKQGDEVIIPSFTFVSTALPFIRQGAKIVFVDSREDHPGLDESKLENLITEKTKAIVPVHYAGVSCNMEVIMDLARKYNLIVIEDAAHAIDSYYQTKPIGSIGHFATFSFHETKNINSGEGGLLAINDERFINRSEIIWEKGTNRAEFFRGEVDKYGWVDIGSSFLPSEIVAAYLWAQLENKDEITQKRINIYNTYKSSLSDWAKTHEVKLPFIPKYASNNGHIFYLILKNIKERDNLIHYLKNKGIHAVFHYQSLHLSKYFLKDNKRITLPYSEKYSNSLMRLPIYYELNNEELDHIISSILTYIC